ncbi:MAG TPA: hypothetical protein VFY68_11060 [Nitrososphaeraceae archaeon]|nr:hypothetical protein [Nitrososphaeraceae archaeon]
MMLAPIDSLDLPFYHIKDSITFSCLSLRVMIWTDDGNKTKKEER